MLRKGTLEEQENQFNMEVYKTPPIKQIPRSPTVITQAVITESQRLDRIKNLHEGIDAAQLPHWPKARISRVPLRGDVYNGSIEPLQHSLF